MDETVLKFKEYQKKMHAYSHALSMLYYDSVTSMPKGGSAALGETIGILSEEEYKLESSEEYKAVLSDLYKRRADLDFITRRETEELFEQQDKLSKIPMDEYVDYQVTLNEAQSVWHTAKAENNFEMFAPLLSKIIDYQKNYIKYMDKKTENPYDVLIGDYEKGLTVKTLDEYFDKLKTQLVPLIGEIGKIPEACNVLQDKTFPAEQQKKLSEYVMKVLTIDREHCNIGETEHPFTLEFSKDDVRITTNYKETELLSNLYSVIHEGGHALYELSIGDDLRGSALAHGVSMGIHESQSRFWENIIGRSFEFCSFLLPKLKELFPEQLAGVSENEFYKSANKAKCSLIRTEADELTYSMHVLVRYEIEKMIFSGDLSVRDIPGVWNELYKKYLCISVPDDTRGVLQDSHWSGGSFGYFPSYSIGSAYSAQILSSMEKELDVFSLAAKGELLPIRNWLSDKIYKYGSLYTPKELIENVCKESFNPDYYTDYLKNKFTKIYGI